MTWLNHNANLKQQLNLDKLTNLLVSIGRDSALDILKHVEEKAVSINDPTAYVVTAARKASSGQALAPTRMIVDQGMRSPPILVPMAFAVASNPASDEKLRKRITWLNHNITMSEPLDLQKIAAEIHGMDITRVMQILKDIEEKAPQVRSPTSWVIKALRNARDALSQTLQAHPLAHFQAPSFFPVAPSAQSTADFDTRLRKRIGWLNSSGLLQSELRFDESSKHLIHLEQKRAMEILKKLEENAATVRDPTSYVSAAAKREPGGGAALFASPVPVPKPSVMFGMDLEKELRKVIGRLNSSGVLKAELRFDQTIGLLMGLDPAKALDILKHLETKAASINDPTGYVSASAKRAAEGGLSTAAPIVADEKIRKRLNWLNQNGQLLALLDYDAVAPELSKLDVRVAMEILKKLEESAAFVLDPNSWVCQTAESYPVAGHGYNKETSSPEEKLRVRINWLNTNAGLAAPLSFESVSASLMRLEIVQAMAILKRLEETAAEVFDPSGFIESAVYEQAGAPM
jgi:hypothetical protein